MSNRIFEQNNRLCARLGKAMLEFSLKNGAWLSFTDSSGRRILDGDNGLPAITLTVGGVSTTSTGNDHLWNIRDTVPVGADFALESYYMRSEPDEALYLNLRSGGWMVRIRYCHNEAKDRIERTAEIVWSGDTEQLLRWAETRMPPLADESEAVLELPGYANILHLPCSTLPVGKFDLASDVIGGDANCSKPGVLVADSRGSRMIAWPFGADMPVFWNIYRGTRGVWFEQKWLCSIRMRPGDSIKTGTEYIRLSDSDKPVGEALSFMQDFWDEADIRIPDDRPTPQWAKNAFIYETHIGPKSFRNSGRVHNPHPDMQSLIDDLPRIRELGFTVLELMPQFPFPNYSVEDYFDIETCYGSLEGMKELVRLAHELGMKVLADVVMHGVVDKTTNSRYAKYSRHPLLDRHPEYFIRTEDGRVAKTYTWSFDQSEENFRAYVTEAFCNYVRELDVDGFRVDAITWNFFPNWRVDAPHPAYKSILGCFGLFEKVREAVWNIKPEIVFYSETTGPLMASSYDLSYNYDEVWVYENLLPPKAEQWPTVKPHKQSDRLSLDARGALEWYDMRQKVMPRGWIKIHHADSHDSHEWGWVGLFRKELFGLEQSRALFAYCCMTEGGVMNYAEAEYGSEELYRKLIDMRKSFPALRDGCCDYLAIQSENRSLFTLLRKKDNQILVPIINFSDTQADSIVDLSGIPHDSSAMYKLTEHIGSSTHECTGAELSRLSVSIRPYGYQLWEVEKL